MLIYENHASIVTALAFSPDGSLLACGTKDGGLNVRDLSGTVTDIWPPGPKPVGILKLNFLAEDRLLIGHSAGWEIVRESEGVWPLVTEASISRIAALAHLSANLLAIGTGERLTSGAGMFLLHDVKQNRTIQPTFREPFGVRAVATVPERGLVAWSTGGREVKVWDIRKQSPVAFRTKTVAPVLTLAPDGSLAAVVQDRTVRIFDLSLKQDRATLTGHVGVISSAAFSPDGSFLATGSWDGTVRFWDPSTGQERAAFRWSVGGIYSLAFAPDGLRIAAGGERGSVVVWDVE